MRTGFIGDVVREIDSYLVRIVRRDGDAIAGSVEQVQSGRTASFATLAELLELLSGRHAFVRKRLHSPTSDTPSTGDNP
jgi:hypothetical protein